MEVGPRRFRVRVLSAAVATLVLGNGLLYWSYGECLSAFFHFDDFWVLGRAAQIASDERASFLSIFAPVHGFLLYRPLSTIGYFLGIRLAFGNDPFWYHLVQMALQSVNASLVCLLAARLLRSPIVGLAAGLTYLTTPGLAIASCWPALCTVTAPTLFGLLALISWTSPSPVIRMTLTPWWFAGALASSEHGVVLPLVLFLATVLIPTAARGRADIATLGLLCALSAAYASYKIYYLRFGVVSDFPDPIVRAVMLQGYTPEFSLAVFLRGIGTYVGYAFSPALFLVQQTASTKMWVGVGLLVALATTVVAFLRTQKRKAHFGIAAFGGAWFVVSLLPVIFLPQHVASYYVAMGAPGISLWILGGARGLRVSRQIAAAMLLGISLVGHWQGRNVILESDEFQFFRNFTHAAERWIRSVAELQLHPHVTEVVVPDSYLAQLVFVQGEVTKSLLCSPIQVRVVRDIDHVPEQPGRVILREPFWYPRDPQTRSRWLPRRCP